MKEKTLKKIPKAKYPGDKKEVAREKSSGKQNAQRFVDEVGLEAAITYWSGKAFYCNSYTSPYILAYWQGYREGLIEASQM